MVLGKKKLKIKHHPMQTMQVVLVIWSMGKEQALKVFKCNVFSIIIAGMS
jgi:hypothetical protein